MCQSLIQAHVRNKHRATMERVVVNGVIADMVQIFVVPVVYQIVTPNLNVESMENKKNVH